MSRSLVYYYFPDKQAVTAAVLDDYLEDLIESVATWNELRAFGDTPSELKKCVSAFRRALYTASGRPRPMITVLEELGMRDKFATRAVREIVACIHRYIVSEYATYRTVDIQLVPETFGLLLFGLEGMMKAKPDITDDELALLIAQTLHLDMRVMDRPVAGAPRCFGMRSDDLSPHKGNKQEGKLRFWKVDDKHRGTFGNRSELLGRRSKVQGADKLNELRIQIAEMTRPPPKQMQRHFYGIPTAVHDGKNKQVPVSYRSPLHAAKDVSRTILYQ